MTFFKVIFLTFFLSVSTFAYGAVESIECILKSHQQIGVLLRGEIILDGSKYFNKSTEDGKNLTISQANANTIAVSLTAHGKTVSMHMRKDFLQLVKAGYVGSLSINEENNEYKNLVTVSCKKSIINYTY